MVHQPAPWIAGFLLRLSQLERKRTPATSSTTPPPKKAATRGISSKAPAISNRIPATLEPIAKNVSRKGAKRPRKAFLCAFAPLRETVSGVMDPASRLRVVDRPSLLNVKKMQTTAAATPPSAPSAIHFHETCNVNAVVPTASTHHVRSPYINNAA